MWQRSLKCRWTAAHIEILDWKKILRKIIRKWKRKVKVRRRRGYMADVSWWFEKQVGLPSVCGRAYITACARSPYNGDRIAQRGPARSPATSRWLDVCMMCMSGWMSQKKEIRRPSCGRNGTLVAKLDHSRGKYLWTRKHRQTSSLILGQSYQWRNPQE